MVYYRRDVEGESPGWRAYCTTDRAMVVVKAQRLSPLSHVQLAHDRDRDQGHHTVDRCQHAPSILQNKHLTRRIDLAPPRQTCAGLTYVTSKQTKTERYRSGCTHIVQIIARCAPSR
ncbi:unnamed protein product, partial [Ectocarpus fasciculatus]